MAEQAPDVFHLDEIDVAASPNRFELAERTLDLQVGTTLEEERQKLARMDDAQREAHANMLAEQAGFMLERTKGFTYPFPYDQAHMREYAQQRTAFWRNAVASLTEEQAAQILAANPHRDQPSTGEALTTARRMSAAHAKGPHHWALGRNIEAYGLSPVLGDATVVGIVAEKVARDPEHVLVGDLMSPLTIMRDLSERVFDATGQRVTTMALDLQDGRSLEGQATDTAIGVHLAVGDILTRDAWDQVEAVAEMHGGFDVLVACPAGPVHFLTNRPQVLFGLADRAYRLLKDTPDDEHDGGTLIVQVPRDGFIRRTSSFDIWEWAATLSASSTIEVVFVPPANPASTGLLRITKKPGAPARLPS